MRALTALLFLLTFPQSLVAQEEMISIRTLAITPTEFPTCWGIGAKDPVQLEFSAIQPSRPYRLSRSNPFRIHVGELDEKGKPTDPAPALLKLPVVSEILLLGWMQAGKPRFLPIPDTSSAGSYNDWYFINTTAKQIAIQAGASAKPVVLAPGSNRVLKIDSPAGVGAAIVMASMQDGDWRKFFSSYWPVQADKRCVILLVQTGEQIEVRQIFDNLERSLPKAGD
jgi:hypothetical protein